MKILFQGDSITDCGRDRQNPSSLGTGYPLFVSARLGAEEPGQHEFINRGISGNRIVDLYARWREDALLLKPDVISILIGVNGVWSDLLLDAGVSKEKFRKFYTMLIEETLNELPSVRLMLIAPFVLPGDKSNAAGYPLFVKGVAEREEIVRELSAQYHIGCFCPQKQFLSVYPLAASGYWLADGVHPTPAGHSLLADAWIETYRQITADSPSLPHTL